MDSVKRDPYFDNLKGILIFFVVLAHYLILYVDGDVASDKIKILYYFVYSFHMPLFVFISGYFSKDVHKARSEAFKKLFVPFCFFNAVMSVTISPDQFLNNIFTPLYVHWYLLALFAWRMVLADIVKVRNIFAISLLAAIAVGFIPSADNFLSIGRIVSFLPFFLLGFYTKGTDIERIRKMSIPYVVLSLATAVALIAYLAHYNLVSTAVFTSAPYSSNNSVIIRIVFFLIALIVGMSLLRLGPGRPLALITHAGKQSVVVFLFHRYLTFLFNYFVPIDSWTNLHFLVALVCSILTLLLLAHRWFTGLYNFVMEAIYHFVFDNDLSNWRSQKFVRSAIVVLTISMLAIGAGTMQISKSPDVDVIFPILGEKTQRELEDAITISFAGDMLLLEDQVKRARIEDADSYDFLPIFANVKPYIVRSDYFIAGLELPVAGRDVGYSRGNFDDGLPISLNAPLEFLQAVKASGINLVTTANNHAYDKGRQGLIGTIESLNHLGIDFLGTYRNLEEKNTAFVADIRGMRVGFIAYTNYVNGQDEKSFLQNEEPHIKILASPRDSEHLIRSINILRRDIEFA
ncbi:MAG: CapA family protein, partial [bacterium]|nr:CapA family protein [bacterium]